MSSSGEVNIRSWSGQVQLMSRSSLEKVCSGQGHFKDMFISMSCSSKMISRSSHDNVGSGVDMKVVSQLRLKIV